jgi:hypothetical protein
MGEKVMFTKLWLASHTDEPVSTDTCRCGTTGHTVEQRYTCPWGCETCQEFLNFTVKLKYIVLTMNMSFGLC